MITWVDVLRQGLRDGLMLGFLVGGLFAIGLGMWVFGPALLAGAGLVYLLRARGREVTF